MAKRTVIDICRLCLKHGQLQLSHLLPRGVLKLLRNPGGPLENPVLVTAKVTMSTSRQVRDYLLCRTCEERFNQLGENYVLRQMKHSREFPLLDRLNVSPPIDFSLREGIYSGSAVGLDTEKLAYFALSVVWRSAVHLWRAADGHVIQQTNLGSFQEPIRKYLISESPFPTDVTVLVTACTDRESQNSAYEPTRVTGTPNTTVAFLACGIHFNVILGTTYPASLRSMCCFTSRQQLVFSRDIRHTTLRAYSAFAATTKEVGVMARTRLAS